jgi:lysophospholipase L1-like esterase
MFKKVPLLFIIAALFWVINLNAQTTPSGDDKASQSNLPASCIPATRTNPKNWMSRHEAFVKRAKQGGINILFMGDSITDFFRNRGSNVWDKYYAPRQAANFGIGGDRTQHVLWRVEHGELDGIHPKVTVLMIGTNNSNSDSASDIARGIKMIIDEIHARIPETKILLLAIFPRNKPTDKPGQRETIRQANELIAKYDDGGKTVKFLDISSAFLGPDGKVHADVMSDFLHPTEKGYGIWARAMEPTLDGMLAN